MNTNKADAANSTMTLLNQSPLGQSLLEQIQTEAQTEPQVETTAEQPKPEQLESDDDYEPM